MSKKFQLTLVLKLHDLFRVINGTYVGLKSYHNIYIRVWSCLVKHP